MIKMLHINTGDEILDRMIKALASRNDDAASSLITVCSEKEDIPPNTEKLIVIYPDESYASGKLHKESSRKYQDRYIPLCRPVSIRLLEDALRKLSRPENIIFPRSAASVYDSTSRILTKDGKSVTLTEKESELYLILREAKGKPVSREELRQRLWKDTDGTNAPDVYVSYLRRKLNTILGEGSLVNVRGAGYLLKEE